jgi:3-oxoacyl-[acyl-carrier protein] reductase
VHDVGAEVRDLYRCCDILVNNAGIYPFIDLSDLDYETWRRVLTVNLDSHPHGEGGPLADEGRPERGASSFWFPTRSASRFPGPTHYMASKMGATGFTRALANDVGAYGITATP